MISPSPYFFMVFKNLSQLKKVKHWFIFIKQAHLDVRVNPVFFSIGCGAVQVSWDRQEDRDTTRFLSFALSKERGACIGRRDSGTEG
jgi:hypothetical protein